MYGFPFKRDPESNKGKSLTDKQTNCSEYKSEMLHLTLEFGEAIRRFLGYQ